MEEREMTATTGYFMAIQTKCNLLFSLVVY